jgi:hypothetical protein
MADDVPSVANGDRSSSHREMKQGASAGPLCAMTLGSPNIAQPSPNRSVPDAKLVSVIVPVDCSIAIDPIKYIRVPFSFDDFKPDSNIIDNDRMPGKPSLPAGSVLGPYSHFMILSFGSRMKRTEEPGVGDRPDQVVSWISFRCDHP